MKETERNCILYCYCKQFLKHYDVTGGRERGGGGGGEQCGGGGIGKGGEHGGGVEEEEENENNNLRTSNYATSVFPHIKRENGEHFC